MKYSCCMLTEQFLCNYQQEIHESSYVVRCHVLWNVELYLLI